MTATTLHPPCTVGTPVAARRGTRPAPPAARARLDRGYLRVSLPGDVELLRGPAWLREQGDGRDPVDVLLRPCRTAVTVTWRDGSRRRFDVAWLRDVPAAVGHTS